MPVSSRASVAALALIGLCLVGRAARAQPSSTSTSRARRLVVMHVAAPAGVLELVVERLRPRLEAELVDLVATAEDTVDVEAVFDDTAANTDAPFAEAWLDGRARAEAKLWLVPGARDRVLTHRTALPAGFDEVALAELVFVVERSVAALLDAQLVGVPKEEARAQLRPPPAVVRAAPPPATTASRRTFDLSAFAGAEVWSGSAGLSPVLGVLGARERERAGTIVGVTIDAAWRRGWSADGSAAHVDVTGASGHLALSLGRRFPGLGTGRIAVGPGVLVDRIRATRAASGAGTVTQARTDADFTLAVRLRWDLELGRDWLCFAMIGADLAAVTGRYTATIDGTTSVLATAWPVRPMFALGLGFEGP
ncbi:MAG TPA: hypothetical protein VHK47_17125 [Polyangia bacterium]|nr:hypothetical protein [Polyangia bacterium]